MAIYTLYDRIKEVATTTGTGTFTLADTVQTGYLRFSDIPGISNSDLVPYCAFDTNASPVTWECGIGTYNLTSKTLARTAITASSSGGTSAINFANVPTVILTQTAANARAFNAYSFRAGRFYVSMPGPVEDAVWSTKVILTPFVVPNPIALATMSVKLGASVNTGTLCLGVVSDDEGLPGTTLVQAAQSVGSGNANSTLSLTTSLFLTPGLYWAAFSATATANSRLAIVPAGSSLYGFQGYQSGAGHTTATAATNQTSLGYYASDTPTTTLPSTYAGLTVNENAFKPPMIILGF